MKQKLRLLFVAALTLIVSYTQAQTADEIVEKYLEAMGGKEKLASIKSVKMIAKGQQGGMEFPMTSVMEAPNKMVQSINFQGKEIVVSAFDGKEMWKTNFMTMKPEKGETEDSQNAAKSADFPDPFLNFKAKGYSISFEGEEKIEGTDCYKIKLTKKPIMVDGKEEEDFSYYYFDKENNVIIMQKQTGKKGQMKDIILEIYMSDYQEVDGIYFAHSIIQKSNGQVGFSMKVDKIELNAPVDAKAYAYPID
jgi:outer membrane lipoprotein-sorting protein